MKKIAGTALLKNLLRPVYHTAQNLIRWYSLQKNKSLRNKFDGERCFLIGTGASLNEIDLTKLDHEFTFGTGFLYSPELDPFVRRGIRKLSHTSSQPKRIRLTFYTALDPVQDPIWEVFGDEGKVAFHLDLWRSADQAFPDPDTIFFVNCDDKRFFEKHQLLMGRKVHYVRTLMSMELAPVQINDLTKRITFLDGAIFFMIAASIYMGFRELYLCGCDYTYQPQQIGHFYNDGVFLEDEPVNRKHSIAGNFADAHGVRIFNVVPDGFESPVYEKVSWDDVVQNVLKPPSVLNLSESASLNQ